MVKTRPKFNKQFLMAEFIPILFVGYCQSLIRTPVQAEPLRVHLWQHFIVKHYIVILVQHLTSYHGFVCEEEIIDWFDYFTGFHFLQGMSQEERTHKTGNFAIIFVLVFFNFNYKIDTWGYIPTSSASARTGIPSRRTASKNLGQRSSGIVKQKSLFKNLINDKDAVESNYCSRTTKLA